MKTFLIGTVAAIGLALGMSPSEASAHWERRPVYRTDACGCRTVVRYRRVWVPDCVPCDPCRPAVSVGVYRADYPPVYDRYAYPPPYGYRP